MRSLFTSILLAATAAFAADPSTIPAHPPMGPGDLLSIRALHVTELGDRNVRIDETGFIHLAMIGKVQAAGRTSHQLATDIEKLLNEFVVDPKVSVEAIEIRSRPVSVSGAVRRPGIYQLEEPKRLADILPLAGGLEPDAGSRVIVTHANGEAQTLAIAEVMSGAIAHQLYMQPHDTVNVPRAQIIYVLGEVRKPGGFPLRDEEHLTALQALALAEGPTGSASTKAARVIRSGDTSEERIVDLRSILAGKASDFVLEPRDILFIPGSTVKRTSVKIAEAAMQMAIGAVVFRR